MKPGLVLFMHRVGKGPLWKGWITKNPPKKVAEMAFSLAFFALLCENRKGVDGVNSQKNRGFFSPFGKMTVFPFLSRRPPRFTHRQKPWQGLAENGFSTLSTALLLLLNNITTTTIGGKGGFRRRFERNERYAFSCTDG